MERDEESGLSYHTARYYAPGLGRWCSADPIGLGESQNVYAYSLGQPIARRDPSGKQSRSVLAQRMIARHALLGENLAGRLSSTSMAERFVPSVLPFTGAGLLLPAVSPYDVSRWGYAEAHTILDELPDRSGFVGSPDHFIRWEAQMRFEMAMNTLDAARSTTGLGALTGLLLYGEEGAQIGMEIEALALSGLLVSAGIRARQTVSAGAQPSAPPSRPRGSAAPRPPDRGPAASIPVPEENPWQERGYFAVTEQETYMVRIGGPGRWGNAALFSSLAEATEYARALAERGAAQLRSEYAMPYQWSTSQEGTQVEGGTVGVWRVPSGTPYILGVAGSQWEAGTLLLNDPRILGQLPPILRDPGYGSPGHERVDYPGGAMQVQLGVPGSALVDTGVSVPITDP